MEEDVSIAVERLCHKRDIDVSEAVNVLIRKGLARESIREDYKQRTRDLGLQIDVKRIAEAVEGLDEPATS